jgi:hypothetical protein
LQQLLQPLTSYCRKQQLQRSDPKHAHEHDGTFWPLLEVPAAALPAAISRPCLDAKYFPKFYYAKRRFPVTSKYRHMYGVLNVDEIKN